MQTQDPYPPQWDMVEHTSNRRNPEVEGGVVQSRLSYISEFDIGDPDSKARTYLCLTGANGSWRWRRDKAGKIKVIPLVQVIPKLMAEADGADGASHRGREYHKGQEGISQLKELIVQISECSCYRPWTITAIHQPHTLHESHSITSVKLGSKTKTLLWCQGSYSNTVRKITGPLPTQPPSYTTQDTAAQNTVRKLT